ncbi:MAG: hypothetical protein CMC76_07050 [Flavobacteriaceae bacterium]|uniref:hypothetical protein n=1 Tax=Winogradskyella sp. SYSU M77433 TaxID=3042722 RepID=UPI000C4C70EB|nr:hypothetical protein [Winogradskyella sp. SYSU M77433]MAX70847.1 hypothetical protein [Flavobacteriaceae bacterium]MDH7911463.1 hypothetical protein [Winogradskyella sp. SYSU M77433]|tara:strand:- start:374 stop:1210 length:837 start_codon:yes stop_codon:yes gene_type:complete
MKKLLLFTLSSIILSCSSENSDNDSPSAGDGSKIKTIKKISSGVTEETTTYEYNSEGNVSSMTFTNIYGESIETTYEYDSENIMVSFTEVELDAWGDTRTEIDYLEYENDLVVKICQDISYSDDLPEVDRIEFEYDDSTQNVSLFRHFYYEDAEFSDCDDVDNISNTETMEFDSNGNMTRYENSDYFWSPTYLTYSYDDKNHPLKNVKPDYFRKLLGASSNNNINAASEYNSDTDELTGTISYEYTYNNSGYPTVMERTYMTEGGSISQSLRYEYTYY